LGLSLVSIGCGGHCAHALSVTRVKALDSGLALYLQDDDDFFPPGAQWTGGLVPYVRDPSDFHSPGVNPPGYGG